MRIVHLLGKLNKKIQKPFYNESGHERSIGKDMQQSSLIQSLPLLPFEFRLCLIWLRPRLIFSSRCRVRVGTLSAGRLAFSPTVGKVDRGSSFYLT